MNVFSEISEILSNSFEAPDFILIASSRYKDIYFSSANRILIQVWNTNTEKLTNDEFQEEANLLLNQIIIYNPVYIITDQRLYRHYLTHEQQNWYITHFVPKLINNGILQFAIVMNENLMYQAKLEEIIDDVKKYGSENIIPTRFFSSITEALHWK